MTIGIGGIGGGSSFFDSMLGADSSPQGMLKRGIVPPPLPPTPSSVSPWCECCERSRPTPYNHVNQNPPHDSWDYCQECYDAGCTGPYDDGCELGVEPDEPLGDCTVCGRTSVPLGTDGWCIEDLEKYEAYLEAHPIPPKDKFTPVYRGEPQPLAHLPAYLLQPNEWSSIDFKPEYLTNPASAPKPTRKKAHIVTQNPTTAPVPTGLSEADVLRLIREATGQDGGGPAGPSTAVTIDQVLESVDPRDSDTAIKLYNWLSDNARLHKIGTLDQGGYLLMYREPEGSTRQGWTAGGTQGDRIVDDALEEAKKAGATRKIKGICKKCFNVVEQDPDTGAVSLEATSPGSDPLVCNDGGGHDIQT